MASQEDIEQQQDLLSTHRRTIAHLLRQAAAHGGETYAPVSVANGMYEARQNIANTKAALRSWGVEVEDLPDDIASVVHFSSAAMVSAPVALPSYGACVVIASERLADQQENHFGALAVAISVIGMVCLYSLLNAVPPLLAGKAINVPAVVGFLLSMGLGAGLVRKYGIAWRTARVGRKGQDQVVEQLRTALDRQWTIYRNLQMPNRESDLDLVLVGPGGVWAVHVNATDAPLRVQADRWQVKRGGQWVAAKPDPGAQVTRQASALKDFFTCNGIMRFVERAIVLAAPQPFDRFSDSEIPVWLPFGIATCAQALATQPPLETAELARINDLLRQRAIEQRAVEGAGKQRR